MELKLILSKFINLFAKMLLGLGILVLVGWYFGFKMLIQLDSQFYLIAFIIVSLALVAWVMRTVQFFRLNAKKIFSMQEKLAQAHDRLQSIIEGSRDLIAAIDLNYNFIVLNAMYKKEVFRLFKIDLEPGMNYQALFSLMDADNREKTKNLWVRALAGESFKVIETFRDKKISNLDYEIHYNPIFDKSGTIIGACHIAANVSERILHENQLRHSKVALEQSVYALAKQNKELGLLKEMMSLLQSNASLKEALFTIRSYASTVLEGTAGIIYLMHPLEKRLVEGSSWGQPKVLSSVLTKKDCWAFLHNEIYKVEDISEDILCHHVKESPIQPSAYLCVPLLVQGGTFGLMYIEVACGGQLTQNFIYLAQIMAEQIALSLFNIQLREELQTKSTHDSLTGLYNRRFFEDYIVNTFVEAEKNARIFSLLLIDIDFFKKINDKYGHLIGDFVLQNTAKCLQSNCRKMDLLCRWGGEEFLLYMPDADKETAQTRAEYIRQSIENLMIAANGLTFVSPTISIGAALYPENGKNIRELLLKADEALYKAKNTGRNRVVVDGLRLGAGPE